MAKEFEHTRCIFFSTGCTTEYIDVELLRLPQIIYWEGEVEWPEFFWGRIIRSATTTDIVIVPITLTNATNQNITST